MLISPIFLLSVANFGPNRIQNDQTARLPRHWISLDNNCHQTYYDHKSSKFTPTVQIFCVSASTGRIEYMASDQIPPPATSQSGFTHCISTTTSYLRDGNTTTTFNAMTCAYLHYIRQPWHIPARVCLSLGQHSGTAAACCIHIKAMTIAINFKVNHKLRFGGY